MFKFYPPASLLPQVRDLNSVSNPILPTTMNPDLINRSKIWFDDGSVVIQAEQTQFRVHRSMLSRHSSVFRDMFSVPQPPGDQEPVIEGCSIVHVSESSRDWENLLTLMYDNFRFTGLFAEKCGWLTFMRTFL